MMSEYWQADLDERDVCGRTRLYRAVAMRQPEIIRTLRRAGADPKLADLCGMTPLHLAAQIGEDQLVKALISGSPKNVGLDLRCEKWRTPLHFAALGGYDHIVRRLLHAGADPTLHDRFGWTPLRLAALSGSTAMIAAIERALRRRSAAGKPELPLDLCPEPLPPIPEMPDLAVAPEPRDTMPVVRKIISSPTAEEYSKWTDNLAAGTVEGIPVERIGLKKIHAEAILYEPGCEGTERELMKTPFDVRFHDETFRGGVKRREAELWEYIPPPVPKRAAEPPAESTAVVEPIVSEGTCSLPTLPIRELKKPHKAGVNGVRYVRQLHKWLAEHRLRKSPALLHRSPEPDGPLNLVRTPAMPETAAENTPKIVDTDITTTTATSATVEPIAESAIPVPMAQRAAGMTSLCYATSHGNVGWVRGLLAGGANPDAREKQFSETSLHVAAKRGDTEIATVLLHAGANRDLRNHEGATPMLLAAQEGHDEIVRILLEAGADPNVRANAGITALHQAAAFGHTMVVKLLINSRTTLDTRMEGGWTPLHFAVQEGFDEIVAMLLVGGAGAQCETLEGATPMHLAAATGQAAILRRLIRTGVDCDHPARRYGTPLHQAAFNDHVECVELLLSAGAARTLRTDDGRTPSELARSDRIRRLLGVRQRS